MVILIIILVPLIALSFDHQNHSKWHKLFHVRYKEKGDRKSPGDPDPTDLKKKEIQIQLMHGSQFALVLFFFEFAPVYIQLDCN